MTKSLSADADLFEVSTYLNWVFKWCSSLINVRWKRNDFYRVNVFMQLFLQSTKSVIDYESLCIIWIKFSMSIILDWISISYLNVSLCSVWAESRSLSYMSKLGSLFNRRCISVPEYFYCWVHTFTSKYISVYLYISVLLFWQEDKPWEWDRLFTEVTSELFVQTEQTEENDIGDQVLP